jgi:two-component system, OmpR family, sensor histidine kinase SenX3
VAALRYRGPDAAINFPHRRAALLARARAEADAEGTDEKSAEGNEDAGVGTDGSDSGDGGGGGGDSRAGGAARRSSLSSPAAGVESAAAAPVVASKSRYMGAYARGSSWKVSARFRVCQLAGRSSAGTTG